MLLLDFGFPFSLVLNLGKYNYHLYLFVIYQDIISYNIRYNIRYLLNPKNTYHKELL